MADLHSLVLKLGLNDLDPNLFAKALRLDGDTPGFERLEFLGDRVLGLAMADILLTKYPDENEGMIAKRFAALVQREALVTIAHALDLPLYLDHIKGDELQEKSKANTVEAILGAIYLDQGYERAKKSIQDLWTDVLDRQVLPPEDPKTALQEWAQGRALPLPQYTLIDRSGPDHNPRFTIQVLVKGHPPFQGTASTKKDAEKDAALKALEGLKSKK